MSHPTYRHLDTPVRLFGLDWHQWLMVLSCAGLVVVMVDVIHPPTQVALFFGTFLIGAPLALTYFAAEGNIGLGTLLRDFARWLHSPRELPAPCDVARVRARGVLLPPASAKPAGASTAAVVFEDLEARWRA